ncbi:hypothetical protein CYK37_30190 [Mesorhizobium loti]|nr:hypothetical protein [Mesorhizobium loti]PLP55561.1 hypothetical protein CYK37_30190 [Mesorhizobium loti]
MSRFEVHAKMIPGSDIERLTMVVQAANSRRAQLKLLAMLDQLGIEPVRVVTAYVRTMGENEQ